MRGVLVRPERPLIEPVPIPDTWVSGMGAIEPLSGGVLRFYCYSEVRPQCYEDPPERVVTLKVVAPIVAVPAAVRMMLQGAGLRALGRRSNVVVLRG